MQNILDPTDCKDSYHVMVVDPNTGSFLASVDDGPQSRLRLPVLDGTEVTYFGSGDSDELCRIVEKMIHHVSRAFYLRGEAEHIYIGIGETALPSVFMFELEDGGDQEEIPHFKWVSQQEADSVEVLPELEAEAIQFLRLYKEQGLEANGSRLWPYSRPGWYRKTCDWVRKEVVRQTGQAVTNIEMVARHSEGCVLRVSLEGDERVYLKAVTPLYDGEVRVCVALGKLMGEHFPAPLAADFENRLVVMKDFGKDVTDRFRGESCDTALYDRVQKMWAHIQKKSIGMREDLEQLGVPVRDAAWIRKKTLEMVNETKFLDAQLECRRDRGVQPYDRQEYKKKFLEGVDEILQHIKAMDFPLTFVHGDLCPHNIAMDESGNIAPYDFGQSCIGFGFLDAIWFNETSIEKRRSEALIRYKEECAAWVSDDELETNVPWMEALSGLKLGCEAYDAWKWSEESSKMAYRNEMKISCGNVVV